MRPAKLKGWKLLWGEEIEMAVSRQDIDCRLYLVFISARFEASANTTSLFLHWLILVYISTVKRTLHRLLSTETR